jgi:hypothetical protein
MSKAKRTDPLAQIAKRRQQEEALLRKELTTVEAQIQTLSLRRDLIASLLGTSSSSSTRQVQSLRPDTEPLSTTSPDEPKLVKCADCSTLVPGPNGRGDCPACGAGPFEEAK